MMDERFWMAALAHLCLVQIAAAAVYLTLSLGMDTPFKAALQQHPELLAIKTGSVRKRRNLYLLGLAVGAGVVLKWRPFG
jgi:hypothetical protein